MGLGRRWVWGLWWEMRPAEGYIWDGFLLPLATPQPTHPYTYLELKLWHKLFLNMTHLLLLCREGEFMGEKSVE